MIIPFTLRDSQFTAPFLNDPARIGKPMLSPPPNKRILTTLAEPFTLESSQPSHAPTTSITTIVTLSHPPFSTGQVVTTPTSHRDEKRVLPASPGHIMESILQLNLGLDVNPAEHSVVCQPSDYGSEASAVPRHHQNDGGLSLLGSSERINPQALRLPPDYRRFYP